VRNSADVLILSCCKERNITGTIICTRHGAMESSTFINLFYNIFENFLFPGTALKVGNDRWGIN
jgi:hypothetical protein